MKIGELVEILKKYNPEEDIKRIHYAENGEYYWWRAETFHTIGQDHEESPLTIVTGELVGW